MHVVNIQSLDLNLLHIFDVLLEERSVTRAGIRLGLSQSAVSHALNRLRHAFGDPLFHRTAQGMQPTARALEVGPGVHASLAQLQAAVNPPTFDPGATDRRFVLAAGAYACAVFIPALVARLAEVAPSAQLIVAPTSDFLGRLDSQQNDFAVSLISSTPARVAQEPLFRETLVWAVNTNHPLASRTHVTLGDLLATPHVVIATDQRPFEPGAGADAAMAAGWQDVILTAELRSRGLQRTVGVTVPDTYSALAVIRRSEMAALIPRRLAQMSAQAGMLRLIEPPYPSPPVDIGLAYLRRRLVEPHIRWMRDLICQVVKETASEP